jgi:hypothetical protein
LYKAKYQGEDVAENNASSDGLNHLSKISALNPKK